MESLAPWFLCGWYSLLTEHRPERAAQDGLQSRSFCHLILCSVLATQPYMAVLVLDPMEAGCKLWTYSLKNSNKFLLTRPQSR
jgi:hypothetical protein